MGRLRIGFAAFVGLAWMGLFVWLFYGANWSPVPRAEWFAFSPPWDDGEPSWIGPWLEKPAGERGFVRTTPEGDFVFEDGLPIRFWGTAFGIGLSAPPKDLVDRMVPRLAKLGFNLVRIRGLDLQLIPSGPSDPQRPGLTLNPERLDRFDYLVSRLKEHGIYLDIVLIGEGVFRPEDGVIDADAPQFTQTYEGRRLLRSMAFVDPYLQTLQKSFIKSFFVHRNPYTGLRYGEEPAIALLEIINETTLTYNWLRDLLNADSPAPIRVTPYYSRLMDVRWNLWLQGRYGSRAELEAAWRPSEPDRLGLLPEEDPQRGTVRRILYSEQKRYSPARVVDTLRFYSELERDYFLGMYSFLKEELGVRVPVSGTHTFHGMANQYVQAQLDFTGGHTQWQHPIFRQNQPWREPPIRAINTPMVLGEAANIPYKADWIETRNTLFRLAYGITAAGKPFVVSEYNHAFPNEYQAEFPLILSAYSRLQGWDGAVIHEYAARPEDFRFQRLYDAFAMHNNPILIAQMPVASLLFRRGSVRPAERSVSIAYTKEQAFSAFLRCGLDVYCILEQRGIEPENALIHRIDNRFVSSPPAPEPAPEPERGGDTFPYAQAPYVSDTGELTWDRDRGLVLINTETVQAAIGFVGGTAIRLRDMRIRARTDFAAISILSLDGQPIPYSSRLLLTAVARVKNRNMQVKRDVAGFYLLTDWGEDEILVQDVQAEVEIYHKGAANLKIFRLDERGHPDTELEGFRRSDRFRFSIGRQNTLWYGLCLPPEGCPAK